MRIYSSRMPKAGQKKKNHRMEETEAGKNNNNICNHTIINNQPLEKNLNN
jgi:hypothetical protein